MANIDKDKMSTASPDIEKHGDEVYGQQHRRSSLGGKFRGSLSVQHVPVDAIEGQIFSMNDVDPALDAKMRIVNAVDTTSTAQMR